MIKKGQKLKAVDECIMNITNEPSLTIGKEYEIYSVVNDGDDDEGEFCVIDDDATIHHFYEEDIGGENKFFEYV